MKKLFLIAAVLLGTSAGHTEEIVREKAVRPSITVVGIECRTSNDPAVGPQQIGQLWGRFFAEDIANRVPNKSAHEVIALYCDYEGDYTQPYSFVLGCPVSSIDQVPEGMVVKTLPASTYAVFPVSGEYPVSVVSVWETIWKSDLKRTYTGDFEVYGEKFFYEAAKPVDVFIAIE